MAADLLAKLRSDFPDLIFAEGEAFSWSPKDQRVIYVAHRVQETTGAWSLLHEVAHGLLEHTSYRSDFELIRLEVAAWDKATELGKKYGYHIDSEHVQDCLDTYRDWLHQRSTCPSCNIQSLQEDIRRYRCFNCAQDWTVSSSRFCRPYRLTKQTKAKSADKLKTTFI